MKINDVQAPTTIPPKSNLKDFLVPADNVMFYKVAAAGNSFSIVRDIFPATDGGYKTAKSMVEDIKGKRIVVFMPFYVRGQYVPKYYNLDIINITEKKRPK